MQAPAAEGGVLARLRRLAELIGAALFAVMLGAFLLQVFMRFVLNRPLAWTDEVAVLAYIWVIFWGAAFMLPEREQVTFDLAWQALPARGRRVAGIAGALLVAGLMGAALPVFADWTAFMARERTAVLDLPKHWVFAVFLAFAAMTVAGALVRLARLLGRSWRGHV